MRSGRQVIERPRGGSQNLNKYNYKCFLNYFPIIASGCIARPFDKLLSKSMQSTCALCSKQKRLCSGKDLYQSSFRTLMILIIAQQSISFITESFPWDSQGLVFFQTVSFLCQEVRQGQVSKRLEMYSDPDIPSVLVCFRGTRQVWGVKGWDSLGRRTDAVSQM